MALTRVYVAEPRQRHTHETVDEIMGKLANDTVPMEASPENGGMLSWLGNPASSTVGSSDVRHSGQTQAASVAVVPLLRDLLSTSIDPVARVGEMRHLPRWMWQMGVVPGFGPAVSANDTAELWNRYGSYAGKQFSSAYDPALGVPVDPAFRQALDFDIAGATYWDYLPPRNWPVAVRIAKSAQEADDIAQKLGVAGILPAQRGGNAQDAVRHYLGACLTASRYGQAVAKDAGDTHERQLPGPPGDNTMDLWNNYQGRKNVPSLTGNPLQACTQSALDAYRDGQLMLQPFQSNDALDWYRWRRPIASDPMP